VKGGMGGTWSVRQNSRDSRFGRYSPVPIFPHTPCFKASLARLAFHACRARGVA
jgi:hypothetical protein